MPVIKTCVVCNKEFSVPPVRAETAITCSRACRGKLTAKEYADRRITTACQYCGKSITSPPCRSGDREPKYCSKLCASAAQTGIDRPEVPDGHRVTLGTGYVIVYSRHHPFAQNAKTVFEHRLVIERLMREVVPGHPFLVDVSGEMYLRPEVHVHHRNEIKNDNRPENLIACTISGHKALHSGAQVLQGETWPEVDSEVVPGSRRIRVPCVVCGKEVLQKRVDKERGRNPYCSKSCSSSHESGLPGMITKSCPVCGKSFEVKRYKVLEGTGKYCSIACRSKAFTGIPKSQRK